MDERERYRSGLEVRVYCGLPAANGAFKIAAEALAPEPPGTP